MASKRQWSRNRPLVVALALVALLVAGTAFAGGGPVVSDNVQVNDPQLPFPNDFPSRNTPTLAASDDSQNLLAGWDDLAGFCGPPSNRACTPPPVPGITGYAFSTDGGETWTDGGTPFPIGPAHTAGHPWADRGGEEGEEVFFLTSRMRAGASGSAGIGVHRGEFGAGTFAWIDAQLLNSANPNDFYSRQAIAAAKDDSGAAYIVLTNAQEICNIPAFGFGTIEVWRTHDSGDTWQGPVVVSPDQSDSHDPNDPLCGDTGYLQVASAVAVGDDSDEAYLVWQFGPYTDATGATATTSAIAFSRSLDGGVTFAPPTFIVTINAMRENPPVGYAKNRMNDQPRIAVATTGHDKGRIYVTFYQSEQPVSSPITQQSLVSSDVYIMHSDDHGQTWSTPSRITTPVPPTGVKRFWPTVAVRPGGAVDVIYMESQEAQITPNPTDVECNVPLGGGIRRQGPVSSLVDAYWVQSRDGGATFGAPVRVSEVASNWCTATYLFASVLHSNAGDYLGLATGGNRTLALWPDSRSGAFDVYFAEVKGKIKK